jgi:hypothetical protein
MKTTLPITVNVLVVLLTVTDDTRVDPLKPKSGDGGGILVAAVYWSLMQSDAKKPPLISFMYHVPCDEKSYPGLLI